MYCNDAQEQHALERERRKVQERARLQEEERRRREHEVHLRERRVREQEIRHQAALEAAARRRVDQAASEARRVAQRRQLETERLCAARARAAAAARRGVRQVAASASWPTKACHQCRQPFPTKRVREFGDGAPPMFLFAKLECPICFESPEKVGTALVLRQLSDLSEDCTACQTRRAPASLHVAARRCTANRAPPNSGPPERAAAPVVCAGRDPAVRAPPLPVVLLAALRPPVALPAPRARARVTRGGGGARGGAGSGSGGGKTNGAHR